MYSCRPKYQQSVAINQGKNCGANSPRRGNSRPQPQRFWRRSRTRRPIRPVYSRSGEAARLCEAYNAAILRAVSDHLLVLAVHGPLLHIGSVGQGKIPLKRGILVARVVINRLPPSFRASNTCVECAGARALFAVTGWVSLVVRRLRWRAILSIGGRNGNGG